MFTLFFNYNVKDTRRCKQCGAVSENEVREELYTEISCPKNYSELSILVEEYFNIGEIVEYRCEGFGYNGLAEEEKIIIPRHKKHYISHCHFKKNRATQRQTYCEYK